MYKVKYAILVASLFAIAGLLYVHDRLAGMKIRRRLVTYRDMEPDE